jgi:NADH dehydrogenase (ubiquinone) 1 alpha subcomplex subunit 9
LAVFHLQIPPQGLHALNAFLGHTATVFGATGFLGRYIVNRLGTFIGNFNVLDVKASDNAIARQGCTVVVPYREEMAKRHLKLTGDLGRVVFMVRSILFWLG